MERKPGAWMVAASSDPGPQRWMATTMFGFPISTIPPAVSSNWQVVGRRPIRLGSRWATRFHHPADMWAADCRCRWISLSIRRGTFGWAIIGTMLLLLLAV